MYGKAKVTVVYHGADDFAGCRLALASAEGAWDAGAEVRVRRVARLEPAPAAAPDPWRADLLREDADVLDVTAGDLAWADAVLFGASPGDGAAQRRFIRTLGAVLPLWGGRVVPLAAGTPVAADVDEPVDTSKASAVPDASGDVVAVARDEGRRAVAVILALKTDHYRPADAA
jgi:hypothetical protein